MTLNRELFVEDPLTTTIPNDGVAQLGRPTTPEEWAVLRYELASFVCEGEYENGLARILDSYLANLSQLKQPAVWVSGFYGSGKSHLVRVLEHLWADTTFPDGTSARSLVSLPSGVSESLSELSTAARRGGAGTWAASGNLGAEGVDQLGLALLAIVQRGAGLPDGYAPARCALWLHDQGIKNAIAADLADQGTTLDDELRYLNLSEPLARAVLGRRPDLAQSPAQLLERFSAQFADVSSISTDDLVRQLANVLAYVSHTPGQAPHALVVLDEVQQYINDESARALAVQHLIEACSSRFGSRLLVVATGQAELSATDVLLKIRDRFSVAIQLKNQDIDSVVRRVVLRKDQSRLPELRATLDGSTVSGEIHRQLAGSRIAQDGEDDRYLPDDYPLLPTRRKFWEGVLQEADRSGRAGQLRSQLRVIHDANRSVGHSPVGTVIPGDYIYLDQNQKMQSSGLLLKEVQQRIEAERRKGADGELRARVLSLIFLIGLLPESGMNDLGVRATADTIADLLVDDLATSGASFRSSVPATLQALLDQGAIQKIDNKYRLQTAAGREWDQDLRTRRADWLSNNAHLGTARTAEFRKALERLPKFVRQGNLKVRRDLDIVFGDAEFSDGTRIPVRVRTGWEVTERQFADGARAQGTSSPIVYVLIPRERADELKSALAEWKAADETLQVRPTPTTGEGRAAKKSMESVRDNARRKLDDITSELVERAEVRQAGGARADGSSLRDRVEQAALRSADRVFDRFGTADMPGWDKVIQRAREGNASPLDAIDFSGETATHPVTKAVRASLTNAWRYAAAVVKQFGAPPYGWPDDAIRGALYALLAADSVSAQLDGTPVTATAVVPASIGKVQFRIDDTALSAAQRIQLRGLLSKLGVKTEPGDEAGGVATLFERLDNIRGFVSGPAPLPEVVVPAALLAIKSQQGNAQLLAVLDAEGAVLAYQQHLDGLERRLPARKADYSTACALARFSADLADLQPERDQLDAMVANRSLLDDTDPMSPILQALTDGLRAAIRSSYRRLEGAKDGARSRLGQTPGWLTADADLRSRILTECELAASSEPSLATPQDVLASLLSCPLSAWDSMIDAVAARGQRALDAAVAANEPRAVRVPLPAATVRTADEASAYVARVRQTLDAALGEHGVIVVGGA